VRVEITWIAAGKAARLMHHEVERKLIPVAQLLRKAPHQFESLLIPVERERGFQRIVNTDSRRT
jgi:hypothetical protein